MKKTYFKSGDWNATCDVCGFEFKASKLRKRWDGLYVCKDDYEQRHPLDFFRSRAEDPSVPWVRTNDTSTRGEPYVEDLGGTLGAGLYVDADYVGLE